VKEERRERRKESAPFEMVSAGDHCSRRMSRQIEPLALILRAQALVSGTLTWTRT